MFLAFSFTSFGQGQVNAPKKCKKCGKLLKECHYNGKHPSAPTYIKANGTTTLNLQFNSQSSIRTISVTTDASSYSTFGVPSWCAVESKTSSQFTLRINENTTTSTRSDWMEIRTPNGKSARINISQSARPANNGTYIRIDGNTSVNKTYSATSTSETFYITTDADSWSTWGIPTWCSLENKTATSFRLRIEENTSSSSRNDFMKVKTASGQEARLNIEQLGATRTTTIDPDKLNTIVNLLKKDASQTNDKIDYSKAHELPGYRLYVWGKENSIYLGYANNSGQPDGNGIFIASPILSNYEIYNCNGARFYVGHYQNGIKAGKGTCYDKDGKLIYYGNFSNNRPTETYPTTGFSNYRFELIEYLDGSYYIGETKDGNRHGLGVFVWKNGACWYGNWKDGIRKGYGVYIPPTGDFVTGEWDGDTMK